MPGILTQQRSALQAARHQLQQQHKQLKHKRQQPSLTRGNAAISLGLHINMSEPQQHVPNLQVRTGTIAAAGTAAATPKPGHVRVLVQPKDQPKYQDDRILFRVTVSSRVRSTDWGLVCMRLRQAAVRCCRRSLQLSEQLNPQDAARAAAADGKLLEPVVGHPFAFPISTQHSASVLQVEVLGPAGMADKVAAQLDTSAQLQLPEPWSGPAQLAVRRAGSSKVTDYRALQLHGVSRQLEPTALRQSLNASALDLHMHCFQLLVEDSLIAGDSWVGAGQWDRPVWSVQLELTDAGGIRMRSIQQPVVLRVLPKPLAADPAWLEPYLEKQAAATSASASPGANPASAAATANAAAAPADPSPGSAAAAATAAAAHADPSTGSAAAAASTAAVPAGPGSAAAAAKAAATSADRSAGAAASATTTAATTSASLSPAATATATAAPIGAGCTAAAAHTETANPSTPETNSPQQQQQQHTQTQTPPGTPSKASGPGQSVALTPADKKVLSLIAEDWDAYGVQGAEYGARGAKDSRVLSSRCSYAHACRGAAKASSGNGSSSSGSTSRGSSGSSSSNDNNSRGAHTTTPTAPLNRQQKEP
jgi:hypothetical protein